MLKTYWQVVPISIRYGKLSNYPTARRANPCGFIPISIRYGKLANWMAGQSFWLYIHLYSVRKAVQLVCGPIHRGNFARNYNVNTGTRLSIVQTLYLTHLCELM